MTGTVKKSKPTAASPQDFEAALAELESLVNTMESGQLALESSLHAYQRGVELVKYCQNQLKQTEQQVMVLEGELSRPLKDDEKAAP